MNIYIQDDVRVTVIENFFGVLTLNNSSQITPPQFAEKVTTEPANNPAAQTDTPKPSTPDGLDNPSLFPLFRTDKHPLEECQQQLREALLRANTKAEACRNIRQLTTLGYMNIDAYSDQQKAELINPYAEPRFRFNRFDFQKHR